MPEESQFSAAEPLSQTWSALQARLALRPPTPTDISQSAGRRPRPVVEVADLNAVGRRIVVVGTTGSGKTTLAAELARCLNAPHIELDSLHWGPDWTPYPLEQFRAAVAQAIAGERWALDGNYSQVRDLVWPRADTLIWLNYPLWLVYGRLLRRTLGRIVWRQQLWAGNRERLANQFSRDSLFVWAWTSSRRRKIEYPALFQQPQYAHLRVHIFRSPRALARWLAAQEWPT